MAVAVAPSSALREPGTMTLVEIYKELALHERARWELAPCIGLRRKPPMGREHALSSATLLSHLGRSLDGKPFTILMNAPSLELVDGVHYFIPDVCVIPHGLWGPRSNRPTGLWTLAAALPLVVEVWSPSTGEYDMETKFAEYRARGDQEIWRIHPYEMTVTTWRRQQDGSYEETVYTSGEIPVLSLPGVVIPFDVLFQ